MADEESGEEMTMTRRMTLPNPEVYVSPCPKKIERTLKEIPTVVDARGFDAREDAEALREALRGEDAPEIVVRILTSRSDAQRSLIVLRYVALFKRHLHEDIRSRHDGHFRRMLLVLSTPSVELCAQELHNFKARTIVEIFCTRSNRDLDAILEKYTLLYKECFRNQLEKKFPECRGLLRVLCNGRRDESIEVNVEKARRDALSLLQACGFFYNVKTYPNYKKFAFIMSRRSHFQLHSTFEHFQSISDYTIEQLINYRMESPVSYLFLTMVAIARNMDKYFATRIERFLIGPTTNHDKLIRILVMRSEIDLGNIKAEYLAKFKRTLEEDVEVHTSGYYRACLLSLIRHEYAI